jgi:hypothetical protein
MSVFFWSIRFVCITALSYGATFALLVGIHTIVERLCR